MVVSLKCCHSGSGVNKAKTDGKNTSKDPLSGFDGGGRGWGLATTDHVWD